MENRCRLICRVSGYFHQAFYTRMFIILRCLWQMICSTLRICAPIFVLNRVLSALSEYASVRRRQGDFGALSLAVETYMGQFRGLPCALFILSNLLFHSRHAVISNDLPG